MDHSNEMSGGAAGEINSRVDCLERTNSWYFFALERLASLGDLNKDVMTYRDPKFLFVNVGDFLKQFIKFRAIAFYLVDESDNRFVLEDCDPKSEEGLMEKETLYQIEQGNFAWALKKNRPLAVRDRSCKNGLILHSVATKTRVTGMFVGRIEENIDKVPSEQLHLISIILSNTAYAIENGSLFKYVRDQNVNLEQIVNDRTRTLENKARQLKVEIEERVKMEEELKRSNQDLHDFASIASHDLQEPLRKVLMFGDQLRDQFSAEMNGEAVGFLDRMGNAVSRMQGLINELLLFSRVNAKPKLFKETDLRTIVDEVISDLESRIIRSAASIDVENLPRLEVDRMQMRQLFQNLIGNALKFHKKDISPEILIRSRVNGGNDCEIHVKDNGIGVDEKYFSRIFKPFERLHGRSRYEGTGMGLAICQKIIERHCGSIRVQSAPNDGCEFIITLPLKQNQE